MPELLQTTLSYIPHSLLDILIQQESSPDPVRHHMEAAVMFADVSGFTALTEALAEKGDEGPEELTRLLNQYFGELIACAEAEGGDVVKFSGDALTALFVAREEPLSHVLRRAYQAGDAMQAIMQKLAPAQTSVGPVDLALKVGIGGGDVQALQVGGVLKRWEYVITGEGVRQAAAIDSIAKPGDVILSEEAQQIIHQSPLPPKRLTRPDFSAHPEFDEIKIRLQRFLPGAVKAWLVSEEMHDWLGDLRTMSTLFISVTGIDYEQDSSLEELHEFLRAAQNIIYRYQGSGVLLQGCGYSTRYSLG